MSAFNPGSYEEALATHKPMSRNTPLQRVGNKADTIVSRTGRKVSGAGKARKQRPRKKAKRVKISTLKKRAWIEFSIFVRTRGADIDGLNTCYTCDARKHWRELEAGHLVPGRGNAILFDERAVNPQCRRCNGHFRGNTIVYYPKMVAIHGQAAVDEMVAKRYITRKWLPGELQSICEKYRALNAANPLVKEKQ